MMPADPLPSLRKQIEALPRFSVSLTGTPHPETVRLADVLALLPPE